MKDIVDVLIIGAGASGAAIAWSLSKTGMKIVCLEQGDWPNFSTYPSTGRDWESRMWGDYNVNPNQRKLDADYPINVENSPISVANYNGVGGGTVLYSAHFPRFHPSDFLSKTLDGVGEDWPITYEVLDPYYNQNNFMMGVSGLAGDPAYPSKPALMPPLPLGKSATVLAKGFNKLGWHWWPSDSAITTEAYDGRDKCINLGACNTGCAQGAKASTDITYWPHAIRAGVEVRTHCRVRKITMNDKGMATGVIYFDENDLEQHQAAEMVVLACNGIGTPRLLLNSKSSHFPDGLANNSGLVGKNLMFHPYGLTQGVFKKPLDGLKGPSICIWSQEFYESDPSRGFVRGFTHEGVRGIGPITTITEGMIAGRIAWGKNHHKNARDHINRIVGLASICEDLPELHNKVTIDPDLTDSNGIPSPKIDYKISENSWKMLNFSVDRAKEVLKAAGAYDVFSEAPMANAGWHLMGTARMGTDPNNSVVNEWGRSHDIKNLFIVDGSLFVTSAGVNPTSTIQALALYIADNINKRLYNLFD